MKKFWLFLLLPLQLVAFEFRQEIRKAEKGDFMVYAHKQSILLLRIASVTDSALVVEELSSPLAAKPESNLQNWLEQNAPGHTSWSLSQIDLETGKIGSIYSIDEEQFISTNPSFQFLPTLFQLTFTPIPYSSRKMVGPEPLENEIDLRKLWLPKIVFEGKVINPPIAAYSVSWPQDESDLSGKNLDLYFAESQALTYLPYWIEVQAGLSKAKIVALDSGKNLSSPHARLFFEMK